MWAAGLCPRADPFGVSAIRLVSGRARLSIALSAAKPAMLLNGIDWQHSECLHANGAAAYFPGLTTRGNRVLATGKRRHVRA
jgi:hypothetical protein